jgi:hypothetical protein
MTVRKPTLDEWFLAYQVRSLNREFFFNPGTLDADITAIVERYRARGVKLSYPALVVKALALTAQKVPEINRAYVRTPLGDRVVEFDHISVNLPVALQENGQTYLSALVVRDADRKSVGEIAAEIHRAQRRSIDETWLTKIVARRPNNFLWRTALRGVHFAAYRWPGMAALGAGGLSVSSVADHRDAPALRGSSYGPTALTLLITGVRRREDGRWWLELGLGMNHLAMTGLTMARAAPVLRDLLSTEAEQELAAFD